MTVVITETGIFNEVRLHRELSSDKSSYMFPTTTPLLPHELTVESPLPVSTRGNTGTQKTRLRVAIHELLREGQPNEVRVPIIGNLSFSFPLGVSEEGKLKVLHAIRRLASSDDQVLLDLLNLGALPRNQTGSSSS